ncbi:MAG: redoxin domain-containing protein [Myxococcales bacterium]|nr:redoxin domain-containing protein [Myxococcales bacterium]
MRRLTIAIVLLLFLAGLAWAVGEAAPNFSLKDLNGKTYRLADYKGKVVVLSFWMTWCAPCKQEMPFLAQYYEFYKDKGLEVWSITADTPSDMPKVRSIAQHYKLTNPVLLDQDSRVNSLLNPRSDYPLTVLVDKAGKIAWVHVGYQPGDEKLLEAQIKKALGL